MTGRILSHLRRFADDEDGATLVEFALVLSVFLFLLFGLIDFGRLGFALVTGEKATEQAVRMAVVRPVLCSGVPAVVRRSLIGITYLDLPNGTGCTARSGLCEPAATVQCTPSATQPEAAEIWAQVRPLLPGNATLQNLRFSYSYDPALNRVGATYAPVVSVDIVNLDFSFISPLGKLAALAARSGDTGTGASFRFPSMSASLPSEDLR